MATKSLEQFAREMRNAPKVVQSEMRRAVNLAGTALADSSRRRQPSSGILRNVGSMGAPIGVKHDVKGTVRPTALIRATGPLHLLDNLSAAHPITASPSGRQRAGGRKRALRTPYGLRRSVNHPGVKVGKQTFERGINDGLPRARAIVEQAFKRAPGLF